MFRRSAGFLKPSVVRSGPGEAISRPKALALWRKQRRRQQGRKAGPGGLSWKTPQQSDGTITIDPSSTAQTQFALDDDDAMPSLQRSAGGGAALADPFDTSYDVAAAAPSQPQSLEGSDSTSFDALTPPSLRRHGYELEREGASQSHRDTSAMMATDRMSGSGTDLFPARHGHDPIDDALSHNAPAVQLGADLSLRPTNVTSFPQKRDNFELDAQRSDIMKRRTVALPPHLQKLFNKISGFQDTSFDDASLSGELVEHGIGSRPPAVAGEGAAAADGAKGAQPLPKRMAERAKAKLQYGALMDAFENDSFAKANQLEVIGNKFERKFTSWLGATVVSDAESVNANRAAQRAAMILEGPTVGGRIPKLGRDPCPGCGATCQGDKPEEAGYCKPGSVEMYLAKWQNTMKARAEYAQRMQELQRHWEKHGRRVGEEWLDFMTQEEFKAIYGAKPEPYFCSRCVTLRRYEGAKAVESVPVRAKDFSALLSKLKEKPCLVVLVVDLSDFPGSMIPDLPGMISMNNPVIIAANKLDVINPRSWKAVGAHDARLCVSEARLKRWVTNFATRFRLPRHQIKAVVPVSAKKGWNVDALIDAVEKWSNLTLARGSKPLPTYFVGCQNSGKSTLLNMVATKLTPPQPPHPNAKQHYILKRNPNTGKDRIVRKWTVDWAKESMDFDYTRYDVASRTPLLTTSALPGTTINAVAIKLALTGADKGRAYFFDTPGVVPHWANTSPLTLPELFHCVQRAYVAPRYYIITAGNVLFVSGLASIEVIKADGQVAFFVYASPSVKSDICPSDKARKFWGAAVGDTLTPPLEPEKLGDAGRLTESKTYLFECFSNRRVPKAEVYFCGLGYVGFYTERPSDVVLRVRTAPGIVHGVRDPLRVRDMKQFPSWPRLMRQFMSPDVAPAPKKIDTVLELTAEPVNPNEPAQRPIVPAPKPTAGVASDVPFEQLLDELRTQGKLVD